MGHEGDMQRVDLVERVDEPIDARASRGRRRRRWWVLGLVGFLVVALVGGQWVMDARERAASERAERALRAAAPEVLTPVDAHLSVVRRLTSDEMDAGTGRILQGDDGSVTYRWAGDGPGSPAWTARLLGPTPALAASTGVDTSTACLTGADRPGGAGEQDVVCLVTDGGTKTNAESWSEIPATSTHIVVLARGDGSTRAEWPIKLAAYFAVVDGLVVFEDPTEHGVVLTARDQLSGATRWTYEVPIPMEQRGGAVASVAVVGGLVVSQPTSRRLVVLSAAGRVIRDLTTTEGELMGRVSTDVTTGRLVVPDSLGTSSRFLSADGDPHGDVVIDGRPVPVVLDDGSLPGLVLTQDTSVHAWDLATGAQRWQAEMRGTSVQAIVLRGRVYVATVDGVWGYDGDSGTGLWYGSTDDGRRVAGMMTDGRNILIPMESTGAVPRPSALVAYDAVTGVEAFRAPYPQGITTLAPRGHDLVGYDDVHGASVVVR